MDLIHFHCHSEAHFQLVEDLFLRCVPKFNIFALVVLVLGMVVTSAAIDAMIQIPPCTDSSAFSGNIRTDPGRHSGHIWLYSRYSGLRIPSEGHEYARICHGSPECLLECIRMKVDYLPNVVQIKNVWATFGSIQRVFGWF